MLPSAADVETLPLVSVTGLAELLGISRHALHMRLARDHESVPPPDRRLEGCHVWFATSELAAHLGVDDETLYAVSV